MQIRAEGPLLFTEEGNKVTVKNTGDYTIFLDDNMKPLEKTLGDSMANVAIVLQPGDTWTRVNDSSEWLSPPYGLTEVVAMDNPLVRRPRKKVPFPTEKTGRYINLRKP